MSRKRKPSPILGPDGKPYVAPPKKESPLKVEVDGKDISSDVRSVTWTFERDLTARFADAVAGSFAQYFTSNGPLASKPESFRDQVAEQVGRLTADFDGAGGEELPSPPADLSTYRDAYASAAANCLHDDATEMLYGREWVCDACGRTLNRDDMRRAASKRGIYGYFR